MSINYREGYSVTDLKCQDVATHTKKNEDSFLLYGLTEIDKNFYESDSDNIIRENV